MKKNILAAVISFASLSAGAVFGVGPDSSGSSTQDYSFILDSGNSISINRSTEYQSSVHMILELQSVMDINQFQTLKLKLWDYNGTMIGISTGSPYLIDLKYKDGILTNAGAKVTSNETAILASRSIGTGMKVFGGLRMNQFKATIDRPFASYKYELDTGTSTGFTIGAAYEVPQILLRASIQYNAEIKHSKAKEIETISTGALAAVTPDDMVAPSSMIIKLRSALSPRM